MNEAVVFNITAHFICIISLKILESQRLLNMLVKQLSSKEKVKNCELYTHLGVCCFITVSELLVWHASVQQRDDDIKNSHAHTCMHTHACTHMHARACACPHTHTCIHTHTHTHIMDLKKYNMYSIYKQIKYFGPNFHCVFDQNINR